MGKTRFIHSFVENKLVESYLLNRFAQSVINIFFITILVFLLARATGDPAAALVPDDLPEAATDESAEAESPASEESKDDAPAEATPDAEGDAASESGETKDEAPVEAQAPPGEGGETVEQADRP